MTEQVLIKNQTYQISFVESGNCNFRYITHLREYLNKPEVAIGHIFTQASSTYNIYGSSTKCQEPVAFKKPYTGMFIFAQGSEDSITTKPYARQLKEAIEKYGLGQVTEIGPVPNPRHMNKPGYVYLWIIDEPACAKWWEGNVRDQKLEQVIVPVVETVKEPECASIAEATSQTSVVTAPKAADIALNVAAVNAKPVRKPRAPRKKKTLVSLPEQI